MFFIILINTFILFISCGGGTKDDDLSTTPSNLVITANIVGANTSNPNGDGSGTIILNFSAENATSYKVNLGNGQIIETSFKTLTHTYVNSGTNTYTIYISAYNADKFISKSVAVTIYVVSKLLWSDEFNTNGAPNPTYWNYDIGTGSNGWGNNELQFYTNRAENVIVENGILKIIAKKEIYSGSNYTSARILTKDKFSFKYGSVEIRAKLPTGGGTWPALWMLGSNIGTVGWPACGEIDIMEHKGNDLNKIYSALHHPGHSGSNPDSGNITISNATTEFHIYKVDWKENSIKFYVDNQLIYSFSNNQNVPFNHNFFLIFNCAMGGNFGGSIDPNFTSATFEIDYVRVFQ
ncbi:MAG: glycoside hydrolase family 16 protein [Flavobacteriaceae bacterium]|nr:glycoside hydrolase family 16 protein [Flavobacteriaceae bacterium]